MDAGRAWRIRPQGDSSPWSDAVLKTDGGKIEKLQEVNAPRDAAAARFVPQPAPAATLTKQADGSVLVHLAPSPGGQTLIFQLTANTPAQITALAGVPAKVDMAAGKPILGRFVAIPQGMDVVLRPAGPGRLDVVMESTLDHWPEGVTPLPKRPPNLMPFDISDTTQVRKSAHLAW